LLISSPSHAGLLDVTREPFTVILLDVTLYRFVFNK